MSDKLKKLITTLNSFLSIDITDTREGEDGWWHVYIEFDKTNTGWQDLEFLAWAIHDGIRTSHFIQMDAYSGPPHLGNTLEFALFSDEVEPDDVANWLETAKKLFYKEEDKCSSD